MGSVQKFVHGAVCNQIRHCKREIQNDRNKDIDNSRTHLNYSLSPRRLGGEYRYYLKRKQQLYCYGRKDLKTMCGWIITLPKEINDVEQEKAFFQQTYNFLEKRYGAENVIQAVVHYDEGKMEKVMDRWGRSVVNEDGSQKYRLVLGRPHLHFNFIPVVKDRNPKHVQEEKICANDLLTKLELQHFHTDLQKYLNEHGIAGKVITGITKKNGRNYTVEELKKKYEMQKELERLRVIEKKYNEEHQYQMSHERGRW